MTADQEADTDDAAVIPVLAPVNCKQTLPAWGVTREFRFGQFIRLYDERKGADGKTTVTPIVLNADGDVVEPQSGAPAPVGVAADADRAGTVKATPIGLWEAPDFEAALAGNAYPVVLSNPEQAIADGAVDIEGRRYTIGLGPDGVAALRSGEAVLAVARGGPDAAPRVVRLKARQERIGIEGARLNDVLASRTVDAAGGNVRLTEPAMRSLLDTGTALASRAGGSLVRLELDNWHSTSPPMAEAFAVQDLAEFLSAPVIPAKDGSMLRLPLDGAAVAALRSSGHVTVMVNEMAVRLTIRQGGPDPEGPEPVVLGPAYTLTGKHALMSLNDVRRDAIRLITDYTGKVTGHGGSAPATDATPSTPPQFSRIGLPIAILLPWKQTWSLTGFSRGTLLSSLALAPGEETRITVAAWERRAKSLDQSAETDTEQTFDFTSTTRDTEDVFKEVVQSNDFHAQANASLDASYSPGVASITVHADGGITNDAALAVTARTSSQRMRESVTRASTRVRSRRVTRITESVESTSATEVIRTIRNPNRCHTLTLNFHEVLAHYDINVVFNRAAVRLVVLVPNPEPTTEFTPLIVRAHEATLRAGLLDAGLGGGFEACRLLASYKYAETEIKRLADAAKTELDQDRQRTEKDNPDEEKPPNPHLDALVSILKDLRTRYTAFPGSDSSAGLKSIANWKIPPPPAELPPANRWLWMRLVAAKFGDGLLVALGDLLKVANPGPDDARRLVAATPAPGGFPSLDGLGSVSEKEKEDAGLFAASAGALGGPWWWWYPRLKDSGFYNVSDGGIPGLLASLRDKFREWETKESEGKGLEQAAAVVNRANNEQQKSTIADKLEMKFGAEIVGSAYERQEALLSHLNEHRDYYRFVLFQGMPPSEQLQRIMDLAPQLRVGMFEPHVVASDGPNLAIPLTPIAETVVGKVVKNLTDRMQAASDEALTAGGKIATDKVILTTPGVSVESWLGECSGCEETLAQTHAAEARIALAEARIRELEAARRKAMLEAEDLSDPDPPVSPVLRVSVEQHSPD